ncbi:glyoxalase [bacterium]|nr:glyoxalase [bacterium]
MEPVLFILYVADQQVSRDFYQRLLDRKPALDVPGMTEFVLNDGASLGLMPADGIAGIISGPLPHPATGGGIPRAELYLRVDDPQAGLDRLVESGGTSISAAQLRPWNDVVAYGADPDAHVIALARPATASA